MASLYSKWNLLFVSDDAGLASRTWIIIHLILKNKAVMKSNMDYLIHVLIQFFIENKNIAL